MKKPKIKTPCRKSLKLSAGRLPVWRMAYGVWRMAYGVWRMAYGVWRMAYGVWRMGYEFLPFLGNALHCTIPAYEVGIL